MSVALMAKKPAPKSKADLDKMVPRTVKMRQEYAEWAERFASRERISLSALLDRALAAHAAATGFEPPPERVV